MPSDPEPAPEATPETSDTPDTESVERVLINPKLTETLKGECDSLRDDLQQANELAADFQRQLASKSNEVATMKQFFEKTRGHLVQLQNSIKELRQERHQLANEVMAATAVSVKLKLERDLLRSDMQSLLEGLDGCGHDILELAIKFKQQALEKPKTKPAPDGAPARKLVLPPVPTSGLEIKWLG